ncbi:MAG: hypothetical protein H7336_16420 [Bacteriovorax sp.]|nr:hypothetical protein [Bacteriovorax sp.]
MALIVFPIVHIAFNFTNQSKKKGVFLSKEYIYFSEGELRILWDDLEVEIVKSFPLLKYTELRFKSFKTSESTIAYIFIDNRDSYKVLIEKYVRKTHMLALIFKNL